MKKTLPLLAVALLLSVSLSAQDETLIVNYLFTGTASSAEVSLGELTKADGWAGRRVHMDEVPLRGNGEVTMRSESSGEVLYRTSFSMLFQEWQQTEEATRVRRSFENYYQLPMPSERVIITVQLYGLHGEVLTTFTHSVDPDDILIRPVGTLPPAYKYIHQSGDPRDCIDVAIVSEGYTEEEMSLFYEDALAAYESIMEHEPFRSLKDRFNFVAVELPSRDSGVSIPGRGLWKDTAVGSHFNTFYMDRYLTTEHLKGLSESLAGVPYEHIIILANTDNYGGGGIYNSYTLTTAHHPQFRPVVVHEFGHSFAGLADEYYYDDQYSETYLPGIEPWEQNITTMTSFESKWQDMLSDPEVGVFEGGGYQSKGVWRSREDCRMKTNACEDFCPVCRRAIERMIRFYTEQ